MPEKYSQKLIKRARALHVKVAPLLVEQMRLGPDAVHQLRLSVKELAALWQVLKPFLAKGQAAAACRDIGCAGKLLAPARDQHARLTTLEKRIRMAEKDELPALRQAREQLIAQRSDSTEKALMTADIVSRFVQDRERWQGLELSCGRRELIRDGYGRLYRKARKLFRRAARSGKAEDWHRLRRWTKYLAALALPINDSSATAAANRYADLAGKLGDLHDLHELAVTLKALPDQAEPSIRQAIEMVEQRADSLQSKCYKKSRQLFRAPPKSKKVESIL